MLRKIAQKLTDRAARLGYPYVLFGYFGLISYPFYYLLWSYAPIGYESLPARLVVSVLCIPIILKKHWSPKFQPYFILYWYFTLLYCLPFFFFYMLFKNDLSCGWTLNALTTVILSILLMDFTSLLIIIPLGALLAYGFFWLTSPAIPPTHVPYSTILITYGSVIAFGGLFAHRKEAIHQERYSTMLSFSDMIAHEMRTPLVSINMTGVNLKRWLTPLLETYEIASQHKLDIPYIDKRILNKLPDTAVSLEIESAQAQQIINMLLANIEGEKNLGTDLRIYTIVDLVNDALNRYAFDPSDRKLISFDSSYNFKVRANDFFLNVIFNLIRNALHQIKVVDKGEIIIWSTEKKNSNELHFKDTAKGMTKAQLNNLFKPFVSNTKHGTGLGLAFCKAVMESYGGGIRCESKEGEYAEFILSFPKVHEA